MHEHFSHVNRDWGFKVTKETKIRNNYRERESVKVRERDCANDGIIKKEKEGVIAFEDRNGT